MNSKQKANFRKKSAFLNRCTPGFGSLTFVIDIPSYYRDRGTYLPMSTEGTGISRGPVACFPEKFLKFRSSEIAGNTFISSHSRESLASFA